ncbi:DNA-3-methyladenine glycosylase I [Tomitella biformata]|uniref:DNA-3-methyladenine glycosylase I n=1 Tax=Tomitella biformata TaxID=630403 RepID=UPI0004657DC6|nr:DNA-3-methyladenine glycosylase I [Tomitella biformata]
MTTPRPDVTTHADGKDRCGWLNADDDYVRYHDEEWGRPLHGEREMFEQITLEGFQAGLSWLTILRRRDHFREVFHDFDLDRVAAMSPADVERLLQDARIIRHRGKIEATIVNAQLVRDLDGGLDKLMWSFAPPSRKNRLQRLNQVPAVTPEAEAMSRALRRLGFKFVGPTTMYALMQSTGMVDDHVTRCWRAS